jgi:hypothetical protein
VWEHFKKIDEKKVKCNHCAKELVYTGGTSNLRSHLDARHPSENVMLSSPKPVKITQFTRSNVCSNDRAKTISNLIAKFLAVDMRPINLIEVSVDICIIYVPVPAIQYRKRGLLYHLTQWMP